MDIVWYHRLFYIPIILMAFSFFLAFILKAKRMGMPEGGKIWRTFQMIGLIIIIVILWFIPFSINLAFWIGLGIVIFSEVIFFFFFIQI